MLPETANIPYRVALPEFEGPLDLLLHLCKTHEIEIVNIPIAFITEKYLEYLELMQTMPVDMAADYLVMAATLCYLKSRELVPSPEPLEVSADEEEEALDPREELIRRLLEYQKYKDAAEKLGSRPIEGRNVFLRGSEIEGSGGLAPLAEHSVWKLIEAFGKLLEKSGKKLTHDVVIDRVSISERINQLIDRIEAGGGSFRFADLFDMNQSEAELRSQLVVTLLAVLELARLKVVRVLQSPDDETLFISQVSGAVLADARRAQVTSAEEHHEAAAPSGESPATAEVQAAAEAVAEPVAAEAVAEPVAEAAAEPVVEAVTERVTEAFVEPVVEGVVEPVVEEVTEPVAEAFVELVFEPAFEPVSEPVVEAVTEPVAEAAPSGEIAASGEIRAEVPTEAGAEASEAGLVGEGEEKNEQT